MSDLKSYRLYIDGEWCDAERGKTFGPVEPATGRPWARMPEASEAGVDRAVDAAERALWSPTWRDMLPPQRAALLRSYLDAAARIIAGTARSMGVAVKD